MIPRDFLPFLVAVQLTACGCSQGETSSPAAPPTTPLQKLTLVKEKKLSKLLPDTFDHYEASGVTHRNGFLFIAFDNMTNIGSVNVSLSAATLGDGELKSSQFEGITYDSRNTPHFYVVQEMDQNRGKIAVFDDLTVYQGAEWTNVSFASNRGLEGIAWVWANDADYLLVLCEGNNCIDDTTNRGNGRVKVLRQKGNDWETEATMVVPPTADFADFSDIALLDAGDGSYKVAIASQESSAVWLGRLTTNPWTLEGPGSVYGFPLGPNGERVYCDVEGITFLNANTIAVVSDKTDSGTSCQAKDESIHIFDIPWLPE